MRDQKEYNLSLIKSILNLSIQRDTISDSSTYIECITSDLSSIQRYVMQSLYDCSSTERIISITDISL
jgi:hypothetical protein